MDFAVRLPIHLIPPKGVIFINQNGVITTYTSTAEKIVRLPIEKVLHHSYWDVFSDLYFGFSMKQAFQEKMIPSGHHVPCPELAHAEMEAIFISQAKDIPDSALPAPEGIVVIIQNLSDLRRYKSIAIRNEHLKELNKMAALVAHEIRNPLGGIKGFASLLKRDLKENSEQSRLANYIIEGTESLSRLVNQILGYTKPLQLRLEPHDLISLLHSLIVHLKADESVGPHIKWQLEYDQPEIDSLVDPDSLKFALLNLTSNAIQAMPQGGTITLQVSSDETQAYIKVSDTGVGIPKENINKIFSPCFTTRPEGHGFGLMEVHKIIQAHHGEIEFNSEVGAGTTFIIHLPKILASGRIVPFI